VLQVTDVDAEDMMAIFVVCRTDIVGCYEKGYIGPTTKAKCVLSFSYHSSIPVSEEIGSCAKADNFRERFLEF
jgi:hypothetical protein